ncbi:MAG: bifunctional glutamate N-acetyltransferase/amino-acid acetyltransferase ArgJ [SAR202 cluster bacterium]|nr:bifunctional glutamate N-acetyltransferase/amino-acid acetyltransferase ArgJ [SAR202 cluster bacterium]|tara:strand:- start:4474 stop:5694 length:1221 start_codon:yes stop_codon:yes gene_type:complete
MTIQIAPVPNGTVTSAKGFSAGAVFAGIKTPGTDKRDIGLLLSDKPCNVAGTFTQNSIISPSASLTRDRVGINKKVKAVVANSGCANCAVGDQGLLDAKETTDIAALHLGTTSEETLVASTGVIGVELPMALMREYIPKINVTEDGGSEFAKAILTTDKRSKEIAISFEADGITHTVGGVSKGSGMIHPNMATMLAFTTTDANVDPAFLQETLSNAVKLSFNQIDVDGDQSTNDTVILMANGAAEGALLKGGDDASDAFAQAVLEVCKHLAIEIARDGEGATKLIEVTVDGAHSDDDALRASRACAASLLVKTAVYGRDPNWGRIFMAVGKSGIKLDESKINCYVNDIQIVADGKGISYNVQSVVSALGDDEVRLRVNLNVGNGSGQAWGCDLTEEYVVFNSAYTT